MPQGENRELVIVTVLLVAVHAAGDCCSSRR